MKPMSFFLVTLFVCSMAIAANDHLDTYAQKIIELRSEVEILNSDYESQKKSLETDLKALALERADLETRIRHEKLKSQQLKEQLQGERKKAGPTPSLVLDETFTLKIHPLFSSLKDSIKQQIPVFVKQRLLQVEKIENDFLQPESRVQATQDFWTFLEDEKRLAQETALLQHPISIDKKEYMAQVVKVGMMLMYFTLEDGRVGQAEKVSDGSWEFVLLEDKKQAEGVVHLIDSLKKQVRQGVFDLPVHSLKRQKKGQETQSLRTKNKEEDPHA